MLFGRSRWFTTVLVSLFVLSACSGQKQQKQTAVEAPAASAVQAEVKTSNMPMYTILSEADFMPFVFRSESGNLEGFNIDIMQAIADKEHFGLRYTTMPFEKMFVEIRDNDRYDILSASLTITDERKKNMAFSDPYFEARQAVILNSNIPEIKSLSELKNYRISVQRGTTSEAILKEIMGADAKTNIIYTHTTFGGIREAATLESDGTLADNATLLHYYNFYTKQDKKKIKIFIDSEYPVEYYAFAVRKNRNDDLLQKINQGLAAIKADGTYQKIYDKWFVAN